MHVYISSAELCLTLCTCVKCDKKKLTRSIAGGDTMSWQYQRKTHGHGKDCFCRKTMDSSVLANIHTPTPWLKANYERRKKKELSGVNQVRSETVLLIRWSRLSWNWILCFRALLNVPNTVHTTPILLERRRLQMVPRCIAINQHLPNRKPGNGTLSGTRLWPAASPELLD